MTLHIFNPENDLALACPSPHFIPPASARQMADDLSALPVWWAMRGDAVCVASVEEAALGGRNRRDLSGSEMGRARRLAFGCRRCSLGVESVDGATSVDGRRGQKPFAR